MVVSKLNQSEVFDVGRIVSELGAKTFCATPMVPSHESNYPQALSGVECKQALRTLLAVRKAFDINVDTLEPVARCLFDEAEEDDFIFFFGNRICSAAVTSCVVSSSGLVRPCIHADKSFGNILQEDFSAIWAKMAPWSEESMLPVECAGCAASAICGGGCRMSAKAASGSYCGKDMYMTCPIADKERARKYRPCAKQVLSFGDSTIFEISAGVRLREESFGGIVYRSGSNIEFCTKEGFTVIKKIVSAGRFSLDSIAPMIADDNIGREDARGILVRLSQRGIITVTEKGGDLKWTPR